MRSKTERSGDAAPRGRRHRKVLALCLTSALAVLAALWVARALRPTDRLELDDEAFTLYVLGGSAAVGVPYDGRADFGLIVARLFDGTLDGRRIEVVNLALSGRDAAFALERAREVARLGPPAQRSAVLLYTGNNEFLVDLNRDRVELFAEPVLSAERRAAVEDAYRARLEAICDVLEGGPALFVSTVAINLAWEPNRSVLARPEHAAPIGRRLDSAEAALAAGDAEAALAELRAALELEPTFAWAWTLTGDALRALGRADEAWHAYLQGFEYDGSPTSATPTLNAIVRAVAGRGGSQLVDGEDLVRRAAQDGLPGDELFWDNVHLTLPGALAVARGFALALEQHFGVRMSDPDLDPDRLARALGLDDAADVDALHKSGQYCYGLAASTFRPDRRLERAERYLEQAERRAPHDADVLCSLGVLRLLQGDLAASRPFWRRARALDAELAEQRAQRPEVGRVLRRLGANPADLFDG